MDSNKVAKIDKHIDALDGIRAIAIFFVVWFHLWQQNWITPYIFLNNTFFKYLGIEQIPVHFFVRYGYVLVDLLVFLSAFCNFYPYVRSMILGEPWPNTREFYFKRFVRIVPSYFLAVLVSAIIAAATGLYGNDTRFMVWDIFTHLTCISGFFPSTFIGTKMNPVLWTVEMEVIFYIFIPFLASQLKKRPGVTYSLMMLISILFTYGTIYGHAESIRGYVNYPLTFLCMYANGFLACYVFTVIKRDLNESNYSQIFFTAVSMFSVLIFYLVIKKFGDYEDKNVYQMSIRMLTSFIFSIFTISTCLSIGWYRKIFGNKIMGFICFISYNLYIWHQYIFALMVKYHIPGYTGDHNPAWDSDAAWQWKYTLCAVFIVICVAIFTTICVEIPAKKFIEKRFKNKFVKADKE